MNLIIIIWLLRKNNIKSKKMEINEIKIFIN